MKNPSATQYCQLFYCLDSYKHFPVQKMCLFPIYQRVYLLYFSLPLFQKNTKHTKKPENKSTYIDSQLHLRTSRVHKEQVFLLGTSILLSCSNEVTAILILSWTSNHVNSSPSFQLKWRRRMWYKIITDLEWFFEGWGYCCLVVVLFFFPFSKDFLSSLCIL